MQTANLSTSLFTASQLRVSIGNSPILNQLDFQLESGKLVGIIGPNGSGKTTLIRTMSGVLSYSGSLAFDGREVSLWDKKKLARHMAVLPQNPDIMFDFTVHDYVMLGRMPHKGWLESENHVDQQKVDAVLADLDLRGMAGRFLPSLSGGERQRVLLAQALVQETPTLLLDEPTQHLDVYHQFDFLKRIRRFVNSHVEDNNTENGNTENGGNTVIIVFHDLALAARFTDVLMVMQAGRLVAHGKTSDILTTELIKDVFRMSARVHFPTDPSDSNPPHIYFSDQS